MNPIPASIPAPAPPTPPVQMQIPTEYVSPAQFSSPPPPQAAEGGGIGMFAATTPPPQAKAGQAGNLKHDVPMQFSTPTGEVSWISILLLSLFVVTSGYQIVLAHQQIKKSRDENEKLADLQKRITALESNKRS